MHSDRKKFQSILIHSHLLERITTFSIKNKIFIHIYIYYTYQICIVAAFIVSIIMFSSMYITMYTLVYIKRQFRIVTGQVFVNVISAFCTLVSRVRWSTNFVTCIRYVTVIQICPIHTLKTACILDARPFIILRYKVCFLWLN